MAGPTRLLWPYLLSFFLLLLLALTFSPFSFLPTSSFSTFPYDPSHSLSYRTHLELTTSPLSQITHSPTLSFDKILVLSLPHRTDRRDQMNKLARALGLKLEFVDAARKEEPFFKWIAERVAETRKLRVELMAKARKVSPTSLGGLHIGNDWLSPSLLPPSSSSPSPFPPHPKDWITTLEQAHSSSNLSLLLPSNPNLDVSALLWDPKEPLSVRQISEGPMSTYWGHTRVLKKVVEEGLGSALVLEDDVDFEWDLERMWSRIEGRLPGGGGGKEGGGWEMVMLGHCWGFELTNPAYLHPLLHLSTVPKCLHSYAVSAVGARRLLNLLSNPWSAYTTAIDLAVPSYISWGLLESFSVEPPLVIQRKDGPSDLQSGHGSKWRGVLRDSTWARIEKDEGIEREEEKWDPERANWDPARMLRESEKCGP